MEIQPDRITIRRADDMHVHLRDGHIMELVLPFTTRRFARAIIMPNLVPPVVRYKEAEGYRERIMKCVDPLSGFTPLMTAYLTDDTDPSDIRRGFERFAWYAAKLYPAGATTNSAHGVTDINKILLVLEKMETIGMPLLIHGELLRDHDGHEIDPFHREQRFIPTFNRVRAQFPKLKVVFEHVTSEEAVNLVMRQHLQGMPTAATITPHHLLIDRRDIFRGGIRPHLWCLPPPKKWSDRVALRKAATSGLPCFFAGTDSAPHLIEKKHCECGAAGIFNAHGALELYAQVFEEEGKLERLEAFTSEYGALFYGLSLNKGEITLKKKPWRVQGRYADIVPFRAGEEIPWQIVD